VLTLIVLFEPAASVKGRGGGDRRARLCTERVPPFSTRCAAAAAEGKLLARAARSRGAHDQIPALTVVAPE